MATEQYSREQLSEMVDQLQSQVSRHLKVEQDLIDTRKALDQELARFRTFQSYNDRALRTESLEELTTLSLEALVEAFEFERSAMLRFVDDGRGVEVVGHFNCPGMPPRLDFDPEWLQGQDSVIVQRDDPMLRAWSDLGLAQTIICPFLDADRKPYGLLMGGRSIAREHSYDPIRADVRSSFTVMVQQIGALWLNYNLNVVVRERKYSVLFHRSNDTVLLAELDGTIVDTNERTLDMLGRDKHELIGMPVYMLSEEPVRDAHRQHITRLRDEGSTRFESCCVRKDGSMFPVEITASVFELDGKQMIHCLIRDVTELRLSQRQLVLSDRMAALGQLVAGVAHEINTPVGVIRASVGNIESSLTGTLTQLPELLRSMPPEHMQAFIKLLDRARAARQTLTAREQRSLRRKLSERLHEHGIDNADAVADTLADMADTGIVESLDELVGLLRHDDGRALEAAYQLASLQRNSDSISTAVERASKVVFALKKFAHHDHEGKRSAADIIDGLETVLTLYQNNLKQGVEVVRDFAELPEVSCYPDELNQVWTNLLHNALQAMDNKGRLEIRARRDGGRIVVTVADDGPGIPEAILDRIFEPFFTTKAAGEGSGLGLDICQRIVDRHDGTMAVDSRPGRTVFTVSIPLEEQPNA